MSDATETIREVVRELSDVLITLSAPVHTPAAARERAATTARILERCSEELAETAEAMPRTGESGSGA
jgi:hypothetical protein